MASNIGPLQLLVVLALSLLIPVIAIVFVVRWARNLRSDIRQSARGSGHSVARTEFERLQREVESLKTTVRDDR